MRKLIALMMAFVLVLACASALADDAWTCTACGQGGNVGNFCPQCGAKRPPQTWTCALCGQNDNAGNFCTNCGAAKGAQPTPTPTSVPTATPTPKPAATPTAKATPKPASTVKAGDYVKFGRYEQDNVVANGKESIEWVVLTVKDDKALLLSRYGLERSSFNANSAKQTWENSTVRSWLNGTFLSQAFTNAEQSSIRLTYVEEDYSQCNPNFEPKRIGSDTFDKIFLLSGKEFDTYVAGYSYRMCIPSKYTIGQDSNKSSQRLLDNQFTCWWWLRSPAYNNNILVVDYNGVVDTCYMSHTYGVLRPAMWVDVSALK